MMTHEDEGAEEESKVYKEFAKRNMRVEEWAYAAQ